MNPKMKTAKTLTILAGMVLIGAFMHWGKIHDSPRFHSHFDDNSPFGPSPFGDIRVTAIINGWNGHLDPGFITLPNWFVVLAALGVATCAWLEVHRVWSPPIALPFVLVGYGVLHAGTVAVAFSASNMATLGIGSLFTAVSFLGMLIVLVRQLRLKHKPRLLEAVE
jgi:hypothetical protein